MNSRSIIDMKSLMLPVALSLLLLFCSQVSFLLFHTLAESFAIFVAMLTTVVVWQMYRFTRNHYLMYLGCGYFWVAVLDAIHTLAYKGMSILPESGADVAVQLWIGTRYLEATILLTSPWFLSHSLKRNAVFLLYAVAAVSVLILVMSTNFPVTYVEGKGLTEFKVYSEYAIIGMLVVSAFYLSNQRKLMDQRVYTLVLVSVMLTMMAEMAFTFYVSLYGLSNLVGHIFKLFSFWLIFIAVIRTTLREPFSALSRAETHYDAVPDAAIIVDDFGVILHVNKAACVLANKTTVELIGADNHSIFHGRNISKNDCPVCQAIQNREKHTACVLNADDSVWYDFCVSNIQSENNFIEVIRDVSKEKVTQQSLLKKEHEQHEILDSMVDAVITIDETGSITSFNKTAEVLFGYNSKEIIGKSINLLMPEPDSSNHDSYVQNYMKTGDAHIVGIGREVVALKKDNHVFPMRLSVAELPTDESGKRRFIGSCQDLTLVKQQEEQMHRSQKMDALGTLTGGIAHDYNNMLGVVLGYSDLLKSMLVDQPKLAKYADEIHHASERGAKLTKKLLSFSRQTTTESTRTDINSILQGQQDMLQKMLTVRISLVVDLADNIWPIWLDSNDLEDAILNMSINAMHAMNDVESNAQLTIRTSNQKIGTLEAMMLDLKKGDYVQLSLSDNGSGMDEATKEKIFDPFFSTKGEKGTGLGLSQVFGFIQRAGGAIKVSSELTQGTEFVLYFPRYIEYERDKATENRKAYADLGGSENILIVDDERALLALTSRQLSQQGYQVFSAGNSNKALQILEREHIDLMVSDVIMPGMDGYQLAAAVQEKYPSINIQLVSGYSDNRNKDYVSDTLHENILYKPFSSQDLLKNIRWLLDNNIKQPGVNLTSEKEIIPPLEWTDDLSVGTQEMDEDHKALYSLLNRCIVIANKNKKNKELGDILKELINYTEYHFPREEKLMEACGYTRLHMHKKVHKLLVDTVKKQKKEFDRGDLTVGSLIEFLNGWTEHISGMDKVALLSCKGKEGLVGRALKD